MAFEPARGFHAATGILGAARVVAVKGAREAVLSRCRAWRREGTEHALFDQHRAALHDHVESLARRGLRVLVVALATTVATQLGQTVLTATQDPFVLAAGLGSAGLLVAIVQTPGLSQVFGCTPLDPGGWMIAATAATAGSVGALVLSRLVG